MKKNIILSVVMLFLCFGLTHAQKDTLKKDSVLSTQNVPEFLDDLKDGMSDLDSAVTMIQLISASNHLCLIAQKYSDQWSTNFYAAFSRILCSYLEKDEKKRDAYLDEAEGFLNKAKDLYKTDYDEIDVLYANLANARLSVNPMNRYKKYGDLFNEYINKAKALNPENPRIYYLQGTSVFYTPKMFGGGAKNAAPLFEKAATLFQNESTGNLLKPYWGRKRNDSFLKQCNQQLSKP
jgi:hypothetical protein